jgi:hypothetical protein
VGYLRLEARSLKPTKSRGIGSQPSRIPSWKPPKTPKSKPFRRVCWIKITKQRGTRSSYVTSNKNPSKKRPQNFPTEIPRKSSENHQKGKTGGTRSSLEEPRRIIYTYHERFIQGLTSARSSFPLTRSHHEALKLVLEILRKNRKRKIAK